MISVCMPTYNGEKYIKKQLESILCQLSINDEVIISDDSSTDNTLKICKDFNDKRIKIFENNNFHSPIYNLENALKKSKGDYIFLSDQDDIWIDSKVDICIEKLKEYFLVIHDADIIDKNENILFDSFYKLNNTKKGKIYNLIKNGYLGCCMCFRRELLNSLLPFPQGLPMHDIYIGNFAAFNNYKLSFIDNKLIHYRRHGQNASITSEKSKRSIAERISDRIIILKNIKK